jgi:hypothetical protein
MAVLQLEGESAQLRQVARLFANGDITRDDYRNIRTVMIDAFVADLDVEPAPVARRSGNETLVPVEVPVYVESARPGAAASAPGTAVTADESPMALLAIVGAGVMLLLVAVLAMGLG